MKQVLVESQGTLGLLTTRGQMGPVASLKTHPPQTPRSTLFEITVTGKWSGLHRLLGLDHSHGLPNSLTFHSRPSHDMKTYFTMPTKHSREDRTFCLQAVAAAI